MPQRGHSQDWNVGLAEDLQDPEFARECLLAAMEENLSIQVALSKVIRAYGLKEFAERVQMPSSNLARTLNPNSNVTQKTLNRLLKPVGLHLSVAPLPESRQSTISSLNS